MPNHSKKIKTYYEFLTEVVNNPLLTPAESSSRAGGCGNRRSLAHAQGKALGSNPTLDTERQTDTEEREKE